MTPELEKKIEEAAKQLAGFSPLQEVNDEERYYQSHKCNTYDACIKMAKSDSAKDYWQKGMYTEEAMLNIYRDYQQYLVTSEGVCVDMIEWFKQNKKKEE